jgi:acyl-CoA synthetase (AMP-forming)/AMP-acid ligase II
MDERGYLVITDRMKDMFITGGFNAYPAEIERLLLLTRHRPGGRDRCARRAHGRGGHGLRRATDGHDARPDELIAWARDTMANFKVPRARADRGRAPDERQQQGAEDRAPAVGQGMSDVERPATKSCGRRRARARPARAGTRSASSTAPARCSPRPATAT